MPARTTPQSPFTYIKRKRALRNANKPTAVDIITTRPYINPQLASPLFVLLPAEIRQQIFQLALLSYPDPSRPYSQHSFWYRPGYTHARAITVSLLLTCRRVYLETDLVPVTQNEHVIWGVERSRIPPSTSSYLLDNRMKKSLRNAIQYIHLFTQQFWLEDWSGKWLAYALSWPDGCPPRLKISIRHTDWWYNLLGENSPLALDPKRKGRAKPGAWIEEEEPFEPGSWGQRFIYMNGLKTFELELETIEKKRGELDVIVEKARTWRFPLGDGRILVLDEEATERDAWTGSKHFKGMNAPSASAGLQLRQGSVASFAGLAKKRTYSEPERLSAVDTLQYYIVTLKWRAQDVERDGSVGQASDGADSLVDPPQNVDMPIAPVTVPRSSYNRVNALPTYYG